jgi:hypothetical protein
MQFDFKHPIILLREAEREIQGVENSVLFNDRKYKKTLEKWTASIFGLGYYEHIRECEIKIIQNQNTSVDFILKSGTRDFPFQLTERQEENRERGKEYRELEKNSLMKRKYRPEKGRILGPKWIRASVEKKVSKKYADSQSLNLLVYANFNAYQLREDQITAELNEFKDKFASIWIVTNSSFSSIFSTRGCGYTYGWKFISNLMPPQFQHYYRRGKSH